MVLHASEALRAAANLGAQLCTLKALPVCTIITYNHSLPSNQINSAISVSSAFKPGLILIPWDGP